MHFAYRYVKYGPSFTADPALRAPGSVAAGTEERLAANEVAVDVGSCCFWIPAWFVFGNRRNR